jgi:hypothetical protein
MVVAHVSTCFTPTLFFLISTTFLLSRQHASSGPTLQSFDTQHIIHSSKSSCPPPTSTYGVPSGLTLPPL